MRTASSITRTCTDTNRHPWLRRVLLSILLLFVLAAPALGGPGGKPATPNALAPLDGDDHSFAAMINDRGKVAGRSVGVSTTAVVWDRRGNVTMLLPLGSDQDSFAEAINKRGDVVGYSRAGSSPCGAGDTAVKWDRHGAPSPLAALPGHIETRGFGINDKGVTVGISLEPRRPDCTAAFHAVRWDRKGKPTLLASPSASLPEGFANRVSNNGRVSGFVNDAAGSQFSAVAWDRRNVPTLLPTIPTSPIYIAVGVNNKGTMVGQGFNFGFESQALVWDRHGNPPVALAPLGTDPEALAAGINKHGSVVGMSGVALFAVVFQIFEPPASAVLWDKHGVPTALPPLPGDDFSYGFGVNDRGDVVGYSNSAGTGANTAVVWRKGKGRKK